MAAKQTKAAAAGRRTKQRSTQQTATTRANALRPKQPTRQAPPTGNYTIKREHRVFPTQVSPTLLLEFEERWLREAVPATFIEAFAKVMLVCAIYRAHGLILVSWRTGYSIRFCRLALDRLLHCDGWLSPFGYRRLIQVIADSTGRDGEVDLVLIDLATLVFDSPAIFAVEQAWTLSMGLVE